MTKKVKSEFMDFEKQIGKKEKIVMAVDNIKSVEMILEGDDRPLLEHPDDQVTIAPELAIKKIQAAIQKGVATLVCVDRKALSKQKDKERAFSLARMATIKNAVTKKPITSQKKLKKLLAN